ncbi:GPI-anchored surface protein, putative, partial [Bodo saltans]
MKVCPLFRGSILLIVVVVSLFRIAAGATLYSSNTTSLCNAANSNEAVVDASGYFTSRLPWSCDDVFDCLVEFLSCVNGTLSLCPTDNTSLPGHYPLTMDCSAFGPNVNAPMLQQCLKKRVQCTLNAAQSAPWVSNASCRSWGAPLSNEYNSLYELVVNNTAFHVPPVGPPTADNISLWDNYTATCVVDMCAIASNGIRRTIAEGLTNSTNNTNTSTTSLQLQNVDIGAICSVNLSYPIIPLNVDDIPGCPVASSIAHPYFINVPIASCSAPASCLASYCSCLGGVWDTKATSCDTSRLLDTSTSVARSCFATVMSCILNSALSIYVPGTSPLVPDPCLSWSVLIAQDYLVYYNTIRSSVKSTSLWQACNATACRENAGLIGIAGVTSSFLETACAFPGVSARPTFQAYDPCPYQCPNGQCTVGIMYCSCTASAGITNLQASF